MHENKKPYLFSKNKTSKRDTETILLPVKQIIRSFQVFQVFFLMQMESFTTTGLLKIKLVKS